MNWTNSAYQRVVTKVDPDGSKIPLWPCSAASSLSLFALATTAKASITVRLLAFTTPTTLAAISPTFIFSGSLTPDFGLQYSGTPNNTTWLPIEGVTFAGVKVDAIVGQWTIGATITSQFIVPATSRLITSTKITPNAHVNLPAAWGWHDRRHGHQF